jgi:glycosyltransferase involved in cell wall biosynthesis
MRVLVVHSRYRSEAPSGENHVVDQEAAALEAAGHDVQLFQRSSDDIAQWSLPRRAALPALSVTNPEVNRALARTLAAWRPDVVHVHNTFPMVSPSILRTCWRGRAPVVATLHNYKLLCASGDFFRAGSPCHDCAGGALLPAVGHGCYRGSRPASLAVVAGTAVNRRAWRTLVSGYLFISASHRDLMSGLDLPTERVFVKHNFVEPPPAGPAVARQHRIAYVGRLDAAKGVPLLMTAWSRFRAQFPDSALRLSIAGGGVLEEEVRAWAAGHPSVDLHGHLPRDRAVRLVAGSEAVVVPSQWEETFGLVAVEAMAAGTSPIVPAHGSFPELVTDGVDGDLFRAGDATDLVRCLAAVDARPDEFRERGRRGTATYAARFSTAASVRRLEDVYRFAVANPAYAGHTGAAPGSEAREQPRAASGAGQRTERGGAWERDHD